MVEWLWCLVYPFQFEFMCYALLSAWLVSVPSAMFSCLLVLRGWSLIGDAIGHAVLPGIVVAYLLSLPFWVGAFIAAMVFSLATWFIQLNSTIKPDTIVGVVFSGMFGLGIVLVVSVRSNMDLGHIFFGDSMGVSSSDLARMLYVAVALVLFMVCKRKDLLICAFDSIHASSLGLSVFLVNCCLLCALSCSIVLSVEVVGSVLAVALLVMPGATAVLLSQSFDRMLLIAVLVAFFASIIGSYISFYLDAALGPSIVLCMTLIFLVAFSSSKICLGVRDRRSPHCE